MKNPKDIKASLTLFLIIVLVAFSYLFVGKTARDYLLRGSTFASWTYTSQNPYLNTVTSWDSGFYYSLAADGYANKGEDIVMTSIAVPEKSWIKLFTGAGLVGKDKFALPYSKEGNLVSNAVFLINNEDTPKTVPLYYAYEGITHCMYKGEISFERDVFPISNALADPSACGTVACSQVYVTYYDLAKGTVVYQEQFSVPGSSEPQKLIGGFRPLGLPSEPYTGFECRTVRDFDLKVVSQLDYRSNFTNLSFMPLYPILAKYLGKLFGDVVLSGFVLSFVAFIASAVVLYKIARISLSEKEGITAALIYILFPFSFFNLMFLPISFINLAIFLTVYFTLKSKTALSTVSFIILIYLQWYGFLLLIPLYYLHKEKHSLKKYYTFLITSICAFIPYLWFQHNLTGEWFALLSSRIPWYGGASSFIGSTINYFVHFNRYVLFELGITSAVLVFSYIKFAKQPSDVTQEGDSTLFKSMHKFVLAFLALIVLNGGLTGTFKYWGFIFPLFLVLGKDLSHRGLSKNLILALFVIINFVFFILWTISSRFVV